jgi:hypothetical protein
MEFVAGPSLAGILAAGPVPTVVALDVVAQAAEGLTATPLPTGSSCVLPGVCF